MAAKRICSVDGCGKKHRANGFCYSHDYRNQKHGSPFGGRAAKGELVTWIEQNSLRDEDDCFGWPYNRHEIHGYGSFGHGGKQKNAHVYMCEIANGQKPADGVYEAAHNCGNGWCLNPNHLRWATPKDNQHDKLMHGTDNRGAKHGNSKYTEEQVRLARDMYSSMPATDVAKSLGVTRAFVYSVSNGQSWAWL